MKKIEKKIKKYYLNSLKHESQLERLKQRTDFFDKPDNKRKRVFNYKIAIPIFTTCSIAVFSIIGINALTKDNNSNNPNVQISQTTNRFKKSIIKIESNPSITFTIDDTGVVTSVYGENYDGKLIVHNENFVGQSYENVIQDILNNEIDCGYLLLQENNQKHNNLNISVYSENNQEIDELKQNIQSYLNSKNVFLNNDLSINNQINYEELLSPTYSCNQSDFTGFNDFYSYLEAYYGEEGNTPSSIIEEFNQLSSYYIDKLSYYQAIIESINDELLNGFYNSLEIRLTNYLNGFYNNYLKDDSSYQKIFFELLNQKTELLKNRNDENFNYEKQIELITTSIESLESFKNFVFTGILSPKLDKLEKEIEAIENYITSINDNISKDESFLNKQQTILENKKNEFKNKYSSSSISNKITNIKNELKEYFKQK